MRMPQIYVCAALLLWGLLSLPPAALAHRLNVFAFVDGGEIQVECSFSRGRPAQQGKVEVKDAVTGAALLSGVTNADGLFRFAVPDKVRDLGHDLLIVVNAGEGHQGQWRIAAVELTRPAEGAAVATPVASEPRGSDSAASSGQRSEQAITVTPQELERIIAAALEQKIAPLRQMLAEQYNADPSLRDIIGGIGWLLGLAGIAAWARVRREGKTKRN